MRRFFGLVLLAPLAFGVAACGDSGDGGSVDSNEALQGFMHAIALDFAQVLADAAPVYGAVAIKADGMADCPEGGTAAWTDSGLGGGTLALSACQMKGIAVSGTLSGYLESGPDYVSGTMMSGPISTSGRYTAELNVTNLYISAQIPITDFYTYWEVSATTPGGSALCAWSGGPGCAPSEF
jgi:hypothetical protein